MLITCEASMCAMQDWTFLVQKRELTVLPHNSRKNHLGKTKNRNSLAVTASPLKERWMG
jgi:hypothetical protein